MAGAGDDAANRCTMFVPIDSHPLDGYQVRIAGYSRRVPDSDPAVCYLEPCYAMLL